MRAYELRGKGDGLALQDRLEAEAEVLADFPFPAASAIARRQFPSGAVQEGILLPARVCSLFLYSQKALFQWRIETTTH